MCIYKLMMTAVPDELEVEGAVVPVGQAMLDALVEKLRLLEEHGRATMELLRLGHFAYSSGVAVLSVPPNETVERVREHLEELQQRLQGWRDAVDTARGRHYYLNYYTMRELRHLVEELPRIKEEGAWDSLWDLLRVICPEADKEALRKRALRDPRLAELTEAARSPGEVAMLNALGGLLGSLFGGERPSVRPLEGLYQARQLQGDLLVRSMQSSERGAPVFLCCAEPSKVTELILSIYVRRERAPEAEELLLCSSHTTEEEIELLLRRFFHARGHKREDRLYCLGNAHLLHYGVQLCAVETLRRLEESFGYGEASALLFVSGQEKNSLVIALSQHRLAVSILPSENLMEAVRQVGERYHGRQLEAVAASMNGVGKTHHILRRIKGAQDEYLEACRRPTPVMHHVEIRESTDVSSLVSALLGDPTDPRYPTAVHLDLAHILPSHVDTLLFELLVVGMLRDPRRHAVYHRRKQDFFLLEIPNTPSEQTAKQLSFCQLLPRTYLTMSAERMDPETPVVGSAPVGEGEGEGEGEGRQERVAPFVGLEANEGLVLVGKTLAAMRVEAFNPKSKSFNVRWTAATVAPEDAHSTYALLEDVCSSETSPPSFLVFTNFVRFLGQLVGGAEGWNMMNLGLLQNFDPGLKHFKHCFFRLLIETSRDFALRQVPKHMPQLGQGPAPFQTQAT